MDAAELGPGSVVVRAWAPWCSNCRAMHPVVDDVAATGTVRLIDLQVEESPECAAHLGIRSVPTLVAFRDGDEVGRLVGARPRTAIESLFETAAGTTGEIRATTPATLLTARTVVGTVLALGGVALDSVVLVAIGGALALWGLAGAARRVTTARSWRPT